MKYKMKNISAMSNIFATYKERIEPPHKYKERMELHTR